MADGPLDIVNTCDAAAPMTRADAYPINLTLTAFSNESVHQVYL